MRAQILGYIEELRKLHTMWLLSMKEQQGYTGPLWSAKLDDLKDMSKEDLDRLTAEQDRWTLEQAKKSKALEGEIHAKGSVVRDQVAALGAPVVPIIVDIVKEEGVQSIAELLVNVLADIAPGADAATAALISVMQQDTKDRFNGKVACVAATALGRVGGGAATRALQDVCKRKRLLIMFKYSEPLRAAAQGALKAIA